VADELARAGGLPGGANLVVPPSLDKQEPNRIEMTWAAEKPVPLPKEGWRPGAVLAPFTATPLNHISALSFTKRKHPTLYGPAHVVQDCDIQLADGMTLRAVSEAINIEVPFFSYRRDWKLEGQDLRSRTRSCPPLRPARVRQRL
jgi:hypothetical protein